MNSIERVLAALTFGKGEYGRPDRVPSLPVPLMQGAIVHQCTVEEYYAMSAEKIAETQVTLNQMLDGIPDGVAGFPNVIQDVAGFGVPLDYHYENSTPAAGKMLIRDFSDIDSLTCPNPLASEVLQKTLGIISSLKTRIGSEKVILGACIAPFSMPSMLMGTSKWMRLLFTPELRKKYYDRLIDVCERYTVTWAKAQLAAGAHVIVLADGMASATMLPKYMFEEFAKPVIQRTIAQIPGMVAYEAVGCIEPYVESCTDLGAVAILIGEEDNIVSCKKKLGEKLAIIGNVNNMKMRRWSAARVELHAKQALIQGMDGYGFALSNQGPEIPFDTPIENIEALVRAVTKFGVYEEKTSKKKNCELALA